jgi:peptidoglycan/LPS O-acetylase OafA/YrhL
VSGKFGGLTGGNALAETALGTTAPSRATVTVPTGTGDRRQPPFRLGHVPTLDGVRGIAVALVVVYHLGQLLWLDAEAWLLPGGFVGVDLFFALSGFLITALLFGEYDRRGRVDLVGFIRRRVVRLVPALAVVLAALSALAVVDLLPQDPTELAKRSGWTLLFTQNWPTEHHLVHPELAHTWSLAVEGHFYLLWSVAATVVFALVRRHPRQVLLALAGLGIAAVMVTRAMRYGDGQHPLVLFPTTPARLDGPLVGAVAGIAYASGWLERIPRRWIGPLALAGLLGIVGLAVVADPWGGGVYRGGFTGIDAVGAVAVLGAAMLRPEQPLARVLRSGVLVALGRASYSLFLWHMPVFVILNREATGWSIPLRAAFAMAVTGVLAAASYLLVERPIQQRRSRRRDPVGIANPADTGVMVRVQAPADA